MNNNLSNQTLQNNTPAKTGSESSLCVGCSQFFGNPMQDNLCSKCYKNHVKAVLGAKANERAAHTTTTSATQPSSSSSNPEQAKPSEEAKENERPKQEDKSRCWNCHKKVGVMGLACRCGYTYCSTHRLPEDHSCSFDYTGKGKEALKQSNPIVESAKIDKF